MLRNNLFSVLKGLRFLMESTMLGVFLKLFLYFKDLKAKNLAEKGLKFTTFNKFVRIFMIKTASNPSI